MILSNIDILDARKRGDIVISEFDLKRLNPNSYNLRLHDELVTYNHPIDDEVLDVRKINRTSVYNIPKKGTILNPGILYLARTTEYTETRNLVPMLEGRSSLARLGVSVHATAGFGDNGFCGYWTLEISVVQPVRIYAGIDVCQIFYHTMLTIGSAYKGKYQNNTGIQASKSFED